MKLTRPLHTSLFVRFFVLVAEVFPKISALTIAMDQDYLCVMSTCSLMSRFL